MSTSRLIAVVIALSAAPSFLDRTLSSVRSSDNAARKRYAACDVSVGVPLLSAKAHILHVLLAKHLHTGLVATMDYKLSRSFHERSCAVRLDVMFFEIRHERMSVERMSQVRRRWWTRRLWRRREGRHCRF